MFPARARLGAHGDATWLGVKGHCVYRCNLGKGFGLSNCGGGAQI